MRSATPRSSQVAAKISMSVCKFWLHCEKTMSNDICMRAKTESGFEAKLIEIFLFLIIYLVFLENVFPIPMAANFIIIS